MKISKLLVCFGAASALLLCGCGGNENSDSPPAVTSQSKFIKSTQKVIPPVKTPAYTKPTFSSPPTRRADSFRKEYRNKLRDSLIKGGMDEDSVDDFMNRSDKVNEDSTRTTLSQEEMRKKYLGE